MSEYISTNHPQRSPSIFTNVLAFTVTLMVTACMAGGSATDLRCEHLVNPLGIDAVKPRLSWVMKTDARAQSQYAYQVVVASSDSELSKGRADLWDSGQIQSSQSILVPYAGKPLESHKEYFWKVRVWSDAKTVSSWSKPAKWCMGVLAASDFGGAMWIGLDEQDITNVLADTCWISFPEGDPAKAGPIETNWFRKEIHIPPHRKIRRAMFQYTGDNECHGWLGEFDLGAKNNFKTVKWNDITTRIESGKTYVFGLVGRNEDTNENPAGVAGLMSVEFTTGAPMIVRTDEGWKASKSFANSWNKLGFDDSKWVAAKALGQVGIEPWGETRTADDRRFPPRWLRKEFVVEKKIKRATVSYSGLGSSELYLNGAKVGDAVLSPALSQYNKRAFYVTHDVTKQLKRGANALGAVLSAGRYASDRGKIHAGRLNFGSPKLLLLLRVEYTDGSVGEVVSDASWKLTTDGPIIASGEFDGEEYDARRELKGWSKPDYSPPNNFQWFLGDIRGQQEISRSLSDPNTKVTLEALPRWKPVQLVSAPGPLSAQMIEPIRVTQTIHPISYREVKPGVLVYDMGQNMVGWCRLRVKGSAGLTVQMRFAETVNPDGSLCMANLRGAQVTDTYTLQGRGKEVWEPRFTYHSFRYVEVTGLPGIATLAALEGRVVNDDMTRAGVFKCSNELLNQLYTNVLWGTRGNYRSIPTHCPQRDERQGWLGDRSEECRGESYVFDNSKLYAKWMQEISDSQKLSGSLPDIAPAYWPIYSDNVIWPSTFVIVPNILHRQYGDIAPIAANYNCAKLWLDYMNRFMTNGIIAKDSYGDWHVPPEEMKLSHSKDPEGHTDKALLATSYFYNNLKLMERYANLLGKADETTRYGKWAGEVKSAFNNKFLNRELGYYDKGSQTSCVLALAFGLVPNDMHEKVFKQLVNKITNETNGHIGTGLIGGQYLCRVLSDNGRADLVYKMATQKDYLGWGYMTTNGATPIWKLWNSNTADPTLKSGNRDILVGDLIIWINEYLAGISADPTQPGFKHIVMKPHPVGDLKSAKATYRSPYGMILSDWRKDGRKFEWDVEIPANSTATVFVPKMAKQSLTESGNPLGQAQGVKLLRSEGDRIILRLGSGKYHLKSE
ncbi:MAG: Bacterial alpha-L-rhamnosidase [Verrucomicrobia bacterium]|nr:MAG: Bacterial alpha-L-rhamnosidase [Verrucomicrobiota bacterium]